jgi:ubiquinone/menaquinone biosynthesis C-methylase UbiE
LALPPFSNVTCVDISQAAFDIAQTKLPEAKKLLGSNCSLPQEESEQFDAAFASHVIYHADSNEQEKAVRELIRLCKTGGRIVIIYSNPGSPIRHAAGALHRLRKRISSGKTVQEAGALLLTTSACMVEAVQRCLRYFDEALGCYRQLRRAELFLRIGGNCPAGVTEFQAMAISNRYSR